MRRCQCSERPLAITGSRVVVEDGKAWRVLVFACSNKRCSEYKKKVFERWINLQNNTEIKEIDL